MLITKTQKKNIITKSNQLILEISFKISAKIPEGAKLRIISFVDSSIIALLMTHIK